MEQVFDNLDLMKLIYRYLNHTDMYNLSLSAKLQYKHTVYVFNMAKIYLYKQKSIIWNGISESYLCNSFSLFNLALTIYEYDHYINTAFCINGLDMILYNPKGTHDLNLIKYPYIFRNIAKYLNQKDLYKLSLVSRGVNNSARILLQKMHNYLIDQFSEKTIDKLGSFKPIRNYYEIYGYKDYAHNVKFYERLTKYNILYKIIKPAKFSYNFNTQLKKLDFTTFIYFKSL